MKKISAVKSNTTSSGHWNKPDGGFCVSMSTTGVPIVPCVGNKTGWRTVGQYIHHLIHNTNFPNRIWLYFDDGSEELIWWYQKGFLNHNLLIELGLSDALAPYDVR